MATIEIRIRTLAQLFESLDPAPFRERTLDPAAESYIVDCASEFPPQAELLLHISAPQSICVNAADTVEAIHNHFGFAYLQAEHRNRRRMHAGRVALVIGLGVMGISLTLRALLGAWAMAPFGTVVAEGLLILGWVVLWRPAEILLFERWESRQQRLLLKRLAQVRTEFSIVPGDPP